MYIALRKNTYNPDILYLAYIHEKNWLQEINFETSLRLNCQKYPCMHECLYDLVSIIKSTTESIAPYYFVKVETKEILFAEHQNCRESHKIKEIPERTWKILDEYLCINR